MVPNSASLPAAVRSLMARREASPPKPPISPLPPPPPMSAAPAVLVDEGNISTCTNPNDAATAAVLDAIAEKISRIGERVRSTAGRGGLAQSVQARGTICA